MNSSLPKPMHTVAGVPMIERVLRAGAGARPDRIGLVVSRETIILASTLGLSDDIQIVIQDPPRGTGDAVRQGFEAIPDVDRLIVLFIDHPLLQPLTVAELLHGSRLSGSKVTLLSAVLADPAAFGRVVRDSEGRPVGVVERKDDDPALREGRTEVYSGMMALDAAWARDALQGLRPSRATGELYLTELVAIAVGGADSNHPWPVATVQGSADDALGVNDRVDLARAESRAWERNGEKLMRAGVTMRLPETIVVDEE
nr:NTP transferase domain-containing protein [Chloroflexia bacterium]